ncbi:MAG: adenine phosphoribosyltransferase [Gemmatimonadota bacterium]|nr:adenine phosphoribosyltransferase [Gemmatimonadota bacterium]
MSAHQPVADQTLVKSLKASIRDVPDFPKPGIVFKDITPVLADPGLFRRTARAMAAPFASAGINYVVGVESRGFILGAPVAIELGAGFIPVRKPGKLPYRTAAAEYALEYGTDRLEIHADAHAPDARVLVVDDVLATGGTASATCRLVEGLGGVVVGCSFLIALSFLPGLATLAGRRVETLVTY